MDLIVVKANSKNPSAKIRDGKALACYMHYFAGIILITYAGSHFGFLFLADANQHLYNLVLPFFTNWSLYLTVGLIEVLTGIVCIIMCGRSLTNVIILTFVAIIIWYRLAYNYVGGSHCGCTGLLGRLFHLNKTQEKIVPVISLILLVFSTTPWLYNISKKGFSRLFLRLAALSVFFTCLTVFGDVTVETSGVIDWQDYIPGNGTPINQYQSHQTFVADISGNTWSISVTNIARPRWWAKIFYDGTNTYTIQPNSQFGILATNQDAVPETNLQKVIIDKSFYPRMDEISTVIGWFTYGLSSQLIHSNNVGVIDMPLPTSSVRNNPKLFGCRWIIHFTEHGRFVADCEAVRDKSLDLTDKEEMLRPEMDYPETLGDYNSYLEALRWREAMPDGVVRLRYNCEEWYKTNNIIIPKSSKLECYLWSIKDGAGPFPWHVYTLKSTSITIHEGLYNLFPKITIPTEVQDYRYKKSNEKRIFRYAEYNLAPGDAWKSGSDPAILANVDDYLKNGRKYTTWSNNIKLWSSWIFLVLICTPTIGMLFFIFGTRNRQPNNKPNNKYEK